MDLRTRLLALFGRRALTGVARSGDEIMKAARRFSKSRVGALIVVERADSLERYLAMGDLVDGALRAETLDTIYSTPTYLNGGATIVRNDRIAAARVLLPLPGDEILRTRGDRLGARHLAAAVLTNETDAVAVVTSEETGTISIAADGQLRRVADPLRGEADLSQLLEKASKRALRIPRCRVNDELARVVARFSKNRVGSLLVFERAMSLQPYVDRAVRVDAAFTLPFIDTIFATPTLLHDGALIVRRGRIECAGAVLPLSQNRDLGCYGTRHRAALGITEESDAVAVVTSEETGRVSVCLGGELRSVVDIETLRHEVFEDDPVEPARPEATG